MTRTLELLILPGDAIGPEVTGAAREVLETLIRTRDLPLRLRSAPVGLDALARFGTTLPEESLRAAREADGVVLGPVSTWEYPPPGQGGVNPSARIRTELDLFANIRPARTWEGVPSVASRMDLVIVRENTEGFYADRNMHRGSGELMPTPDIALALRRITRRASERIAAQALAIAAGRRRQVTVVHKANVLRISDGLFLEGVRTVAERHPEVALSEMLVDAMSARLVLAPGDFDVILTTNMFGDILSDEAAALAGGLGLAGALNAGADHAVAQATHGSAPDIAGRGIANPTAMLLSVAMLLEWLAGRHERPGLRAAARDLEGAVGAALARGELRTPDLGGGATTAELTGGVCALLAQAGEAG